MVKQSDWLRSWVQLPPGPFLPVVQLRYCFELDFGKCRTKSLALLTTLLINKNGYRGGPEDEWWKVLMHVHLMGKEGIITSMNKGSRLYCVFFDALDIMKSVVLHARVMKKPRVSNPSIISNSIIQFYAAFFGNTLSQLQSRTKKSDLIYK